MELSRSSCPLRYLLPIFFLSFGMIMPPANTTNIDFKSLIYKHCANQTSIDPDPSLPSILSTLLQELLVQSSQSRFFETSTGDEKTAISGLFQCRGDLGNEECHNCVNRFSEVSKSLCGDNIPARIQLSGCYIRYQPDGVETSRIQLLHKTCSGLHAGLTGFEELRDAAFAALESGVINGNGFCDMNYEKMHVTAQCVGSLGACDCGECVNNALQIAQEECGYSVSGEIYLDSCFISYSYYQDGINGDLYQKKHAGGSSNKLVAIVVGGIVALLLGAVFCQFMRSCGKKKDDW